MWSLLSTWSIRVDEWVGAKDSPNRRSSIKRRMWFSSASMWMRKLWLFVIKSNITSVLILFRAGSLSNKSDDSSTTESCLITSEKKTTNWVDWDETKCCHLNSPGLLPSLDFVSLALLCVSRSASHPLSDSEVVATYTHKIKKNKAIKFVNQRTNQQKGMNDEWRRETAKKRQEISCLIE